MLKRVSHHNLVSMFVDAGYLAGRMCSNESWRSWERCEEGTLVGCLEVGPKTGSIRKCWAPVSKIRAQEREALFPAVQRGHPLLVMGDFNEELHLTGIGSDRDLVLFTTLRALALDHYPADGPTWRHRRLDHVLGPPATNCPPPSPRSTVPATTLPHVAI